MDKARIVANENYKTHRIHQKIRVLQILLPNVKFLPMPLVHRKINQNLQLCVCFEKVHIGFNVVRNLGNN